MANVVKNPVFLGVSDVEIEKQNQSFCSWETNKLGGYPNWMHESHNFIPCCKVCSCHLCLVAQIYCPLDNSDYHRTLYVFGCVNPSCWDDPKSWQVIRSQLLAQDDNNQETDKAPEGGSFDDWCDDADDWGDDKEYAEAAMEDLITKTNELTIKQANTFEEKPPKAATNSPLLTDQRTYNTPCFMPHYINVFEDTSGQQQSKKTILTAHERALIEQYQQHEGVVIKEIVSGGGAASTKEPGAESYEKTTVAHGDYGFHKFLKYLQSCPKQCVRYQWDGTPLSISNVAPSDIISAIPPCPCCGAPRVFELQLMPALVPLLKHKQQCPSNTNSKSPLASSNISCPSNKRNDVNCESVLEARDISSHSNTTNSPHEDKINGILLADSHSTTCMKNSKTTPNVGNDSYSLATNSSHGDKTTSRDGDSFNIDEGESSQRDEILKKESKNVRENHDESDSEDETWKKETIDFIKGAINTKSIDQNVSNVKEVKDTIIANEEGEKRIEFGTVIVFSCSQSCWDGEVNSLRHEYVIIQADPDAELFQKKDLIMK